MPHFSNVEPKHAQFAAEVDRLVRAAEQDTADALCRLSLAQQAFDRAAEDLRLRLGQIPEATPRPPAPHVPAPDPMDENVIPDRLLQMFWLLLVAFSLVAFSAGFWVGRNLQ